MTFSTFLRALLPTCAALYATAGFAADDTRAADFIILNAKVVTMDSNFSIARAVAVRGNRVVAVGDNMDMELLKGPATRVIDAQGKELLPGLYDSHVHSYTAAVSEFAGSQPVLHSIAEAQDYIRTQTTNKPPGSWIILDGLYPTRMKEGRLPTLKELDSVSSNNPVVWNAGYLTMVNTKAIQISQLTNTMINLSGGEAVRNPRTLKPTGLLRNFPKLPKLPPVRVPTHQQYRQALKRLYELYNEQGITSIAERRADPAAIDLFRELSKDHELTVRINCTRVIETAHSLDDSIATLDAITNSAPGKLPYGPTGVGDDWVRIGPLKVYVDGDVQTATAYLRTPWGIGPTYQIDRPADRGVCYPDTDVFPDLYLEAAQRGWQLAGHAAGDAAMDLLLRCYECVQIHTNITQRRFLATQATFQAVQQWEKLRGLGIWADVQPILLYKDGASLLKTLGTNRIREFLPLKTWFDNGLTIGFGSDHSARLDSVNGVNPWNPWLTIWAALTRQTEDGTVINPEECLTREQALGCYTINNARLNFEEDSKGSLEPGKLADLILIDRDILKCPVDDIKSTKVILTMVNGQVVWEAQWSHTLAESGHD